MSAVGVLSSPSDGPHTLAPPANGPSGPLTENDWEQSPMYIALTSRLSKTESALATLSSQVSQLSSLVRNALPTPPPSLQASGRIGPSQPVFSPFDLPDPSPFIPAPLNGLSSAPFAPHGPASLIPGTPATTSHRDDGSVAALTQQIAALSTSVAQLQRMQSQNITRQNSGPVPALTGGGATGDRGPGPLPFNSRGMADIPAGPLTTGGIPLGPGGLISPAKPLGGTAVGARDFMQSRPNVNRSMSSSVLGNEQNDRWGAVGGGVGGRAGPNGLPMSLAGAMMTPGAGPRDWPSPGVGGMVTPSVSGSGLGGLGGLGGGSTAPGAGIVVTKWDHLNLKQELLRSIAKYGIGPPNKIQARVLPFLLKGSDIIAQAPPTQERIISYVIPALQLCLTLPPSNGPWRGPAVVIITTTVDQASQCYKLIQNVGGPLGIRSALAAGTSGSSGSQNELAAMNRDAVHLLVGTPAKANEVFSVRGGMPGGDVRLLILDEVDQLIARNLYEHVLSITKLLPAPRRGNSGMVTPGMPFSPGGGLGVSSPFDPGQSSPFNPASKTPFPTPSRFGAASSATNSTSPVGVIERQTCIFSNTIPTDVINFSQSLQVRDPVRVLVRRDGGPNSQESVSSVTPGINLKHTYVYLTITGSARSDAAFPQSTESGPGAIGSGRTVAAQNGQMSEEATRAKEFKLDTLVKILDDYPLWQAVIHVGTKSMLEAVVYRLQSRSWEILYLAPDMSPPQKKAVLHQWRHSIAGNGPRFLVVFDVNVKPPEIPWSPLVINFDLPRSVEGYALRAAAAVPPGNSRGSQVNGVIVSFVQAAGGDVEMLRSTECAYRFKSAEIPSVFHDLF